MNFCKLLKFQPRTVFIAPFGGGSNGLSITEAKLSVRTPKFVVIIKFFVVKFTMVKRKRTVNCRSAVVAQEALHEIPPACCRAASIVE